MKVIIRYRGSGGDGEKERKKEYKQYVEAMWKEKK